MSASITWHWGHCQWYHFVCYLEMIKVRPIMTSLVIWCQCWHHMTVMTSTIAPLHLLGQDDWIEVYYDFFSHLTLLALASASYRANDIVNSTAVFIRSRWLKQCQYNLYGHVIPLMLMSELHDGNSNINGTHPFFGQDDPNEIQHDFLVMWCH